MRKTARSIVLAVLTLLSAVAIGVGSTISGGFSLVALQTALIMGGSGTPMPDQEPGYMENVTSYYIFPNTSCSGKNCDTVSVFTPEEAWPLYGGPSALTWKQSILQGVDLLDDEVQPRLAGMNPNAQLVIFGYSQSGAIVSIEKQRLADQLTADEQEHVEWVVTGNVSRPNGGLNGRLPITLPIVEFPFGPTTPTDTNMLTTDIALKWDIIADAPLVVTNPVAMANALIGGPGFGINHGTYPNPEGNPPTGLVGGYTQAEWQAIMDNPEGYAAANPDVVNVQYYGDTKYITVAPRVMPLLVPLHNIGLGFVADLMEPALRDIVEQTGYDRSIPYGQPTTFRLIPIFNPITLTTDLIADIPEGIQQALNGGPPPLTPPTSETTSTMALSSASVDSPGTVDLSKDGTTDPESGPTASNGAEKMLQHAKSKTTATTTNDQVSTTPKLLRPSFIAKPNEGITLPGTGGTATDGQLRNALGDFHPVRDAVKAVSDAVDKALGKDDSTTSTSGG
jgi:PE-PPE domain